MTNVRNCLAIIAIGWAIPCAWGATFSYTGRAYTVSNITNYSSCDTGAGTCVTFTSSMSTSGSFTTTTALSANLSAVEITSQIASYSFSNGVDTFANTDSNSRLVYLRVTTDSSGSVTVVTAYFEKWVAGSAPHAVNDRVHHLLFATWGDQTWHNAHCSSGSTTSASNGVTDTCDLMTMDNSTSSASVNTVGTWSTSAGGATAVPTLPEWGLLLLAMLLGASGWMLLQTRAKARG